MIALYIILTIAIGYALIRAKHDSYLSYGKWKRWAWIEGAYIAICSVSLVLYAFTLPWWLGLVLGFIFTLAFWIVFDCTSGWLRTKNILHLGTVGWDATMREVFKYKKGYVFLGFKIFWLLLSIGWYTSLAKI